MLSLLLDSFITLVPMVQIKILSLLIVILLKQLEGATVLL